MLFGGRAAVTLRECTHKLRLQLTLRGRPGCTNVANPVSRAPQNFAALIRPIQLRSCVRAWRHHALNPKIPMHSADQALAPMHGKLGGRLGAASCQYLGFNAARLRSRSNGQVVSHDAAPPPPRSASSMGGSNTPTGSQNGSAVDTPSEPRLTYPSAEEDDWLVCRFFDENFFTRIVAGYAQDAVVCSAGNLSLCMKTTISCFAPLTIDCLSQMQTIYVKNALSRSMFTPSQGTTA